MLTTIQEIGMEAMNSITTVDVIVFAVVMLIGELTIVNWLLKGINWLVSRIKNRNK